MIAFAELLERLVFTPSRNAKIALLRRYFETEPDPDRGIGLAAIAGDLGFTAAKPGLIRELAATRTDPVLFGWSYDYVGDLAETVALMWPAPPTDAPPPSLATVVATLESAPKAALPGIVAGWLDASDSSVRFALLKLITGGLRVGASARLAKIALAEIGGVDPDEVEEVWHGLVPPYLSLFAWLEGRAARPDPADAPVFRPPMLAQPLGDQNLAALDPAAFRAEWKWDGIRVQLVATKGGRRLYSRGADDISVAFPEIIVAMNFRAVLDGELLVIRDGQVAPFAHLQQRLNRKLVGATMMRNFPVGVRLYDILFDDQEDVRALPFDARRARLEAWFAGVRPARMDLSAMIPFATINELAALRLGARAASMEGIMLKRADSPYVPGRPKGLWWKWKRDPHTVDAVLMYAQRG
ncbi:MAG: cisplatin damage response ATP-dependent DNA ligase, partial [Acetobacteraceae bacterium]